ncbi:MAG: hypothetical protein JXA68_07110 [Ignavibacteriales bacterium]|nr:hypothetical protein [Ignavibacteriales bacterium]
MVVQSSESTVIADTFNFELSGNGVKIEVNKENKNIWVDVEDGYKRMNLDYYKGARSAIIMDSTYSVGTLYIKN